MSEVAIIKIVALLVIGAVGVAAMWALGKAFEPESADTNKGKENG